MCGSMLFAENAGRCTSSSPVVRVKHMLSMHKRMLCARCAGGAGNMGLDCLECFAALASAVQHDGANCKRFKVAWNSMLKMP